NLAPGPVAIHRISPIERWRQIRSARRVTTGERGAGAPGASHHVVDAAAGVQVYRGGTWPAEFYGTLFAGRTPNPCVMCNNWLKFGKLWEFARQIGAEQIASGHYARTEVWPDAEREGPFAPAAGGVVLRRGLDPDKDQSYVLFGIAPEILPRVLFPVGGHTKSQIRELAGRAGLRVASKPDSQEICFVPDQDYAGFLRRYRGELDTAGELVDTQGRVVGHHGGYEQFTIGQRRGLKVTFGEPRYVVAVDAASHRVVVGTRAELACPGLVADRINWLVTLPANRFECLAQVRYNHDPVPATVQVLAADRAQVEFTEPEFGVAPGQAVVFYQGDRVLGGGWICEALRAG
ncbi:MAG: tRNA 2-thiouridine(34) synthase MnmA, partial [Planctomycetaceae bacterium]